VRQLPARVWNALFDYARRVYTNIGDDNVFFLAAGIAFNLLLAVVPFALLVVNGLVLILNQSVDDSRAEVHRIIDLLLPQHVDDIVASPIHELLDEVLRTGGTVSVVSAIGFVFFTTRVFATLRSALTDVFDIEKGRPMWAAKAIDLVLTLAATGLMLAYFLLNTYLAIATPAGTLLLSRVGIEPGVLSGVWQFLGRVLASAFIVSMFYLLYRYLPNRRIRWRPALLGAVSAAALFEIARNVYIAVTTAISSNSVYTGVLFALVSLVGWVYYAAVIFLIGGEVAQAHEIRRVLRLQRETFG
jgi:membrane protein